MNNSFNKGYSRFERNGIIFLSVLILLSIIAKRYVVDYFTIDKKDLPAFEKNKLAQLQQQIKEAKISYGNSYISKDYSENGKSYTDKQVTNATKKDYKDFTIEINSASAEDYEKLYGIGKVYAQRIVTFRNKLGGFYSIDQLKDVYGIEDSVYQKFKKNLTVKPAKIQKLNINTASYEELTANPYFFSTVAKQIIGYRSKVKPFATIEDVKNLYFVKDHPEHYEKMRPYISLN